MRDPAHIPLKGEQLVPYCAYYSNVSTGSSLLLKRFASKIKGWTLRELSKAHMFFAEVLELFPNEEYLRITRAIGWLNQRGKITQDEEGKYQLSDC